MRGTHPRSLPRRALRVAARCAFALVVFTITLLTIEGAASFAVLARDLDESDRTLAEHRHTTWDPLLGWCNVPGTSIRNLYGPGTSLHVNSRGFRGTREHAAEVPPGKLRVVCTGDSFTLGYGVDDDETWVRVLEEREPRLETVNMGQGGYGVDQAYLWYRRDAEDLAHDLHLFALISGDFTRAQRSHNYGLPKPVLVLRDGRLETEGVPVPRGPYRVPFLTHNRERFRNLNVVKLAQSLTGDRTDAHTAMTDRELRRVVLAMFEDLDRLNRERGSRLVVVHLPMKKAYFEDEPTEWEAFLARELEVRGIPYVNLCPDLQRVPAGELSELFIRKGAVDFAGAAGHFTRRGNEWAADRILDRLEDLPEFRDRLDRL